MEDRSLHARIGLSIVTLALAVSIPACADETDALALRSISGVNYEGRTIRIDVEGSTLEATCTLADAEDPTETVGEACLLSPLVTDGGLDFTFNNPLERTTVQLQRRDPTDPSQFEVYDWKTRALHLEGPIARWNGDVQVDALGQRTITRMVSLSCIDNLAELGLPYSNESYEDPELNPCNALDAAGKPMKMREGGGLEAVTGLRTANAGSCTTPDCCDYCGWVTSTSVARYGIDESGAPQGPNPGAQGYGSALHCSPSDGSAVPDKYAECRGFIPRVDRDGEELRWSYDWCQGDVGPDCPLVPGEHPLPLADRLRETHPDLRPRGLESLISRCETTDDCARIHGLSGSECMGTHEDTGATCLADAYPDGACRDAVCRPEWVVSCETSPDTLGPEVAFCVDRRFVPNGGGACFVSTEEVENTGLYGPLAPGGAGFPIDCDANGQSCAGQAGADVPLSACDWNGDGDLTALECCQPALYGPSAAGSSVGELLCDPYYQSNVAPLPAFTRSEDLPGDVQACRCPSERFANALDPGAPCTEVQLDGCFDREGRLIEARAGQYAVKFILRPGGISYDDSTRTVRWTPADTGGLPRAGLESCAQEARTLGGLNRHDGWRAHEGAIPENLENFDRAMCSGQEYRVVFNELGNESNPAVLADEHGSTLADSVYVFETPQFHVRPGSGLDLAAGVGLGFSNKYDVSPENLAKLRLTHVRCTGDGDARTCEPLPPSAGCAPDAPVAGGPACAPSPDALETARASDPCAVPCLTVVVDGQAAGDVVLAIDTEAFGPILEAGETYRVDVPSVPTLAAAQADADAYRSAFWDACGMPLVDEGADAYAYVFTAQ